MKERLIFTIALLICFIYTVDAQYFYVKNNDSLRISFDSLHINFKGAPELSEWQFSHDTVNWEKLNLIDSSISLRLDGNIYYRLKVLEENCPEYFSNEFSIIEKCNEPINNQIIIDSTGGIFCFDNGIKFKIPANSLETETKTTVNFYDSVGAHVNYLNPASQDKNFICAFDFVGDHSEFINPVRIKIPYNDLAFGDYPKIFQYDTVQNVWDQYQGTIYYSADEKIIEFTIYELIPLRIDNIPHFFNLDLITGNQEDINTSYLREKTLCNDKLKIESKSVDISEINSESNCYYLEDKGSIVFLDCPGTLPQSWGMIEIGKTCEPQFSYEILNQYGCNVYKVGDQVSILIKTFTIVAGLEIPLANQEINIYPSDFILPEKESYFTNDEGTVIIDFTLLKPGTSIEVPFDVNFSICTSLSSASAGGITESNCISDEVIEKDEEVLTFSVIDDCSDFSQHPALNTESCSSLVDEIISDISFDVAIFEAFEGLHTPIPITAYNWKGEIIPSSDMIIWESLNPDILTIENGLVYGIDSGCGLVTASLCDRTEYIEVCVISKYRLVVQNKVSYTYEYASSETNSFTEGYDSIQLFVDFIIDKNNTIQILDQVGYVLLEWEETVETKRECIDEAGGVYGIFIHSYVEVVKEIYENIEIQLLFEQLENGCNFYFSLISISDYTGRYKGEGEGNHCSGQDFTEEWNDVYHDFTYYFDDGTNELTLTSEDCGYFSGEKSIVPIYYGEGAEVISGGVFKAEIFKL